MWFLKCVIFFIGAQLLLNYVMGNIFGKYEPKKIYESIKMYMKKHLKQTENWKRQNFNLVDWS